MGIPLSWESIAASVVGTAHTADGGYCQDRSWAGVNEGKSGPVLVMLVADGAGSAARGEAGAALVVETARTILTGLSDEHALLDDCLATFVLDAIRIAIDDKALQEQMQVRDFASTFLALVSTSSATLTFQVGDGGIVLDTGEGLELAITPMSGEYANMTRFVTDDNAMEYLATRRYERFTQRAAVFSDGIQRLALDMQANKPHSPFFTPLFSVIERTPDGQRDALQAALEVFLDSTAVNARTDDDKSIALAVLRS